MSPGLAKIGAALVLTSPFVPMIFHGEEWGAGTPFLYFTDHQDTALARAVSEGRRREFARFGIEAHDVPDPQASETFERSKLDWTELGRPPHASMLDWYRRLIRLRREHRDLADGRLDRVRVSFDERERWLHVHRGSFTIACNLSDAHRSVPLTSDRRRRVLLASDSAVTLAAEAIQLPPESVTILGR